MSSLRFASAIVLVAFAGVLGCSSDAPPATRVYINSDLGPGNNGSAICQISSAPWIQIDNNGGSVTNGEAATSGARVAAQCTVTSAGDGSFTVYATASIQGTTGGSVTVSGKFTTSGAQSNIHGVFQRSDTGSFEEADCTVDYSGNPNMGVASGRVWGKLSCPTITKKDSNPPRACSGNAEFKFENCGQ